MIIKYNILTVRCFNQKRAGDLYIQPIDARLAAVYSIAVKLYRSSAERKHPSLQCKIWIHLIKSWGPNEESSWKLMSSGCSAGWRVITLQYVCILWMGFDEVVILNRGNKFVSWLPCLFSFSLFKMKGRPWLGIFCVYRFRIFILERGLWSNWVKFTWKPTKRNIGPWKSNKEHTQPTPICLILPSFLHGFEKLQC